MAEQVLGWCQMFRRQFGEAKRHFDRAYALNPNDADALVVRGWYLGYTAQHAACEEALESARRLNPLLPDNWTGSAAALRVLGGRYEEAIAVAAELSCDPWPKFPGWLAIAHAHLGHAEEARSLGADFVRNVRQRWCGDPRAGDREFVKWFFLDNPVQY